MLPRSAKWMLNLQRTMGQLNLIWTAPLLWFLCFVIMGYRCHDLASVRKRMREIRRESQGRPMIICGNHLTKIDSVLLILFLFPLWQIFGRFRLMPWNVPELTHIRGNPLYSIFCYLGKCIPIQRSGSARRKALTVKKLSYLLLRSEYLCVFPEGKRSRSGRVLPQQAVYGVGRLLMQAPQSQVLCVYLRADNQVGFSDLPRHLSRFHCDMELISPVTPQTGMRGARELTIEVMTRLKQMEDTYFASLPRTPDRQPDGRSGQRYCRQK